MADTYFANVSLLLHCNGTDASTTFTDSGPVGHTVTAVGGAQIDTAQSKWGGASGLFDGGDDKLTVPSHTSLDLTTGDFTIEFWMRPSDVSSAPWSPMGRPASSGATPWGFAFDESTGELSFYAHNGSDSLVVSIIGSATINAGTWYHVAVTRSGSTFRLYVDGVHQGVASSAATLKSSTQPLQIGDDGGGFWFPGWLDDIRITKGVARYTGSGSFTPPAAQFEGGAHSGYIAAPGPLGAPALLGTASQANGRISAPGVLGAPALVAFTDWTGRLAPASQQLAQFVLDLVTPSGDVRVPMSSWQATLTTDGECYAGCVIPACLPYADDLEAATAFVISRRAVLADGTTFYAAVIVCPLQTLQIDTGPTNATASLSGYFDAIPEDDDPPAAYDRTLTGVRSTSTYTSGVRVRADIDWLLRPGQRAFYLDTSMVVTYQNLYATSDGRGVQAYMDVGERL